MQVKYPIHSKEGKQKGETNKNSRPHTKPKSNTLLDLNKFPDSPHLKNKPDFYRANSKEKIRTPIIRSNSLSNDGLRRLARPKNAIGVDVPHSHMHTSTVNIIPIIGRPMASSFNVDINLIHADQTADKKIDLVCDEQKAEVKEALQI